MTDIIKRLGIDWLDAEFNDVSAEASYEIESLRQQLVQHKARELSLREALTQQNFWVEGALKCKEWEWDGNQRECADGCLERVKEVLALPQDNTALEAVVAKAGKVMCEWCADECNEAYGWNGAKEAIGALPNVILKDLA